MARFAGRVGEKRRSVSSFIPSSALYVSGGALLQLFTGVSFLDYVNVPALSAIVAGDVLKFSSLAFKGRKREVLGTVANYLRLGGFMFASAVPARDMVDHIIPFDEILGYNSLLFHGQEFINAGLAGYQAISMAYDDSDVGGLFVVPPLLFATGLTGFYEVGTSNVAGELLRELLCVSPVFCASDLLKKSENEKARGLGTLSYFLGAGFCAGLGAYCYFGGFGDYVNGLANDSVNDLVGNLFPEVFFPGPPFYVNRSTVGRSLLFGAPFSAGFGVARGLLQRRKEKKRNSSLRLDLDEWSKELYYDADRGAWGLGDDGRYFVRAKKKLEICVGEDELDEGIHEKILSKFPNLGELELTVNVERDLGAGRVHRWRLKRKIKRRLKDFWRFYKYKYGLEGEMNTEDNYLDYVVFY